MKFLINPLSILKEEAGCIGHGTCTSFTCTVVGCKQNFINGSGKSNVNADSRKNVCSSFCWSNVCNPTKIMPW